MKKEENVQRYRNLKLEGVLASTNAFSPCMHKYPTSLLFKKNVGSCSNRTPHYRFAYFLLSSNDSKMIFKFEKAFH